MAKRKFILPYVVLSGDGLNPADPDNPIVEPGTGQGSPDIEPYDWEMWSVMFDEADVDGDGTPGTWDDYVLWMTQNGFEDYIDWDQNPNP